MHRMQRLCVTFVLFSLLATAFAVLPDEYERLFEVHESDSVSGGIGIEQEVTLSDGTRLSGIRRNSVASFKGVRYASAPVGHLRWAPPEPWVNPNVSAVYDATTFGSACHQGFVKGFGSEDCLYLHIWTPADVFKDQKRGGETLKNLPVGVFIHGGSYNTGAGSMYSGADMIRFWEGGAVIVTVNYRLNVFGFLGSEELRSQDRETGSTGNYGLQDQRMALQWVRDNIASFGGDKDQVMVFGESAGAGSVSNHLTMHRSWGLFSAVGMESGSFPEWATQPMWAAQSSYKEFLKVTKCEDLACLLALSTQEVFEASVQVPTIDPYLYPYTPTADGVEMTTHPWIALANGDVADVPVLHGTNAEDGGVFVPIRENATLEELHLYWVRRGYSAAEIRQLDALYLNQVYPSEPYVTQEWWAASRSAGDYMFACSAKYTSEKLSSMNRDSNNYLYYFEHARDKVRFVSHFSEVPFVFHWEYAGFKTEADRDMADVMSTYWGNFISKHDPSSEDVGLKGLPEWTAFTSEHESTIRLPSKEGVVMTDGGLKNKECRWMINKLNENIRSMFER